ncbi:MAG: ATP-binding protein [Clostridiales bacterium]|nr:ATP-binding protein [Clostridiales bacterium]
MGMRYGTPVRNFINGQNYSSSRYRTIIENGEKKSNDWSVLELEVNLALESNIIKVFFMPENLLAEGTEKVLTLISRIEESGHKIIPFKDESVLRSKVEEYFKLIFQQKYIHLYERYSDEEKNSNLFHANKLRYYVNNSKTMSALNDYTHNEDRKVLVLYGQPGSGKSTVLSNWIKENKETDEFEIIDSFVGAGKKSTNDIFIPILRKLYSISELDGMDWNSRSKEVDLLDAFYWIVNNFKRTTKRCIIIIDGFDYIGFTEKRRGVYFVPPILPEGIKIIISTCNLYSEYKKFNVYDIDRVNPLDIVRNVLFLEGKQLEYFRFESKLKSMQFAEELPVYFRLLTSEIILSSTFNDIENTIDSYINRKLDLKCLYKSYLHRIEKRVGRDNLRSLCIFLYCSINGFNEDMLLMLTDTEKILDLIHLLYYDCFSQLKMTQSCWYCLSGL